MAIHTGSTATEYSQISQPQIEDGSRSALLQHKPGNLHLIGGCYFNRHGPSTPAHSPSNGYGVQPQIRKPQIQHRLETDQLLLKNKSNKSVFNRWLSFLSAAD